MPETPEHLITATSDRGFRSMPSQRSTYGGSALLYESSDASGPHVWLQVVSPASLNEPDGPEVRAVAHLPLESLRLLRDQADWFLSHHYQLDSEGAGS